METTKDVKVNGSTYQIKRMDAAIGSWLLFKLIDSLRKILAGDDSQPTQQPTQTPEEDKASREAATGALIQGMLMTLDRDLFAEVQREALKVCGQYTAIAEKEVVLPVLMANGKFAIPALQYDIPTVVGLTAQALHFNLSPFFLEGGLNSILQ